MQGANSLLIAVMGSFVAFFAFFGTDKMHLAAEISPTNVRSHVAAIVILSMWVSASHVVQLTANLAGGRGSIAHHLYLCCNYGV